MINTQEYDNRLRQELEWRYIPSIKPIEETDLKATRDKLFWDFRYARGSYKAQKAGISRPSVMMRFCNDKFRLYGDAENNKLFGKAKGILAGWKARNKAEMRALKLLNKKRKEK